MSKRPRAARFWRSGNRDEHPPRRDAELPAGAAFDTYATASRPDAEENIFVGITLSRALLFEGVNVLAAEVHQTNATSSDLRFDARLTRELGAPGVPANDADVDSPLANLTASVLAPPGHGQLSLSVNGGFTYTPVAAARPTLHHSRSCPAEASGTISPTAPIKASTGARALSTTPHSRRDVRHMGTRERLQLSERRRRHDRRQWRRQQQPPRIPRRNEPE